MLDVTACVCHKRPRNYVQGINKKHSTQLKTKKASLSCWGRRRQSDQAAGT